MAQETKTTAELVQYVKAHALRNYTRGWDTIVECYSDEEGMPDRVVDLWNAAWDHAKTRMEAMPL